MIWRFETRNLFFSDNFFYWIRFKIPKQNLMRKNKQVYKIDNKVNLIIKLHFNISKKYFEELIFLKTQWLSLGPNIFQIIIYVSKKWTLLIIGFSSGFSKTTTASIAFDIFWNGKQYFLQKITNSVRWYLKNFVWFWRTIIYQYQGSLHIF